MPNWPWFESLMRMSETEINALPERQRTHVLAVVDWHMRYLKRASRLVDAFAL